MKSRQLLLALWCAGAVSCAQQPAQDPLQNTKKLAREGHATLYRNGAFQVPMTTIHLIPPGPDAWDLAMEMGGMRAAQSFQESIKHARESVGVAQAGVAKSMAAAKTVREGTSNTARAARDVTLSGAHMTAAAPKVGAAIISASVSYAGETYTTTRDAGARLASGSLSAGADLSDATGQAAGALLAGTASVAARTSRATRAAAGRHAGFAAERFVKGYAAVPEKLGKRAGAVADSASLNKFVGAYQQSNEWRAGQSHKLTDIIVDTTGNYAGDIKKSFRAAADEIVKGGKDTGYTLATLKSLRWVLQGIFWDATIKPAGKLTAASLGYVTVNAVAFPAIVTVSEGVAVANVAVQVVWNGAASAYDVTAPTAIAAVAGLFSAVELVGGQAVAGGELLGGSAAAGGTYVAGKAAAGATAGGGYVAGKTVQYVAAPLSTVGVAAGGTAVGVVAGTVTAATGVGVMTAGVAGEAATQVVGNTAAATVAVGGSAASATAGAALGTYELAKAVVVPAGYELGAGMVVSYSTVSQLGAQAVLAVSDASYMVLSLEGPRWVLYAVKGNVDKGEQLPTGALLDLKAMQKSGETFYTVPASGEEMRRVLDSVGEELPVRPKADGAL